MASRSTLTRGAAATGWWRGAPPPSRTSYTSAFHSGECRRSRAVADGMTETHDVPLEGGGYDFRVRVYPASDPNGAVLVWLHGGAFMFGTLEMPEADQVGRRLSAVGITVVSVDYTSHRSTRARRSHHPTPTPILSAQQLRAEAEAAGPRARFPAGRASNRRRIRLGGRERSHLRADPHGWLWAGRAPAPTCPPARPCGCAIEARPRHGFWLSYTRLFTTASCRPMRGPPSYCGMFRERGCSRPRAGQPSTATTCPTATTCTATPSRAAMISRACRRC